jgi:uncharacterized protein YggT (Ycf19 family)
MKTLSIIGDILSVLGVLLSLIIFYIISQFDHFINDLYWNKNNDVYYHVSRASDNYLEIIRESFPPVLMCFYSFFLILSIKVNRRF